MKLTSQKPVSAPLAGIAAIALLAVSAAGIADHNTDESLNARLAPVGTLNVMSAEEAASAAASAAETTEVAAADADGEAVYGTSCLACHGAGVAGAPKVGDAGAWETRLTQGLEVLIKHAIEGYQGAAGVMPARGGNASLSDAEVTAAVEFMVDESS